jgi:hypothetical protein
MKYSYNGDKAKLRLLTSMFHEFNLKFKLSANESEYCIASPRLSLPGIARSTLTFPCNWNFETTSVNVYLDPHWQNSRDSYEPNH